MAKKVIQFPVERRITPDEMTSTLAPSLTFLVFTLMAKLHLLTASEAQAVLDARRAVLNERTAVNVLILHYRLMHNLWIQTVTARGLHRVNYARMGRFQRWRVSWLYKQADKHFRKWDSMTLSGPPAACRVPEIYAKGFYAWQRMRAIESLREYTIWMELRYQYKRFSRLVRKGILA